MEGATVQVGNGIHKRDEVHDKLHQMNLNDLIRGKLHMHQGPQPPSEFYFFVCGASPGQMPTSWYVNSLVTGMKPHFQLRGGNHGHIEFWDE